MESVYIIARIITLYKIRQDQQKGSRVPSSFQCLGAT